MEGFPLSAVTFCTVIFVSPLSKPIHSIVGGPETPIVRVTVQVRLYDCPAMAVADDGVISTVGGWTKRKTNISKRD